MVETDVLWGGRLVSVSLDPVAWTLRFGIEVLTNEEQLRYELMLGGVTQWHASRGIPLPWNYAEVTEVRVSEVMDQVLVEMVLWNDDTSITARCAHVRIDRLT